MGNASRIPILSTDKRGSCAVAKYILRVTNFLLKLLDALVVLQFRETIVSFSHYIKIYSRHQSAQEQVLLQNIYYICLKDSGAAFLSHFFFFYKAKVMVPPEFREISLVEMADFSTSCEAEPDCAGKNGKEPTQSTCTSCGAVQNPRCKNAWKRDISTRTSCAAVSSVAREIGG